MECVRLFLVWQQLPDHQASYREGPTTRSQMYGSTSSALSDSSKKR